jgi:hypothetical protein
MSDYSTVLTSRLMEVTLKLEGLQEDQAIASADLSTLQQSLESATDDSRDADDRERERLTLLLSELQHELETSRKAATQSLQKKIDHFKTPLWICILGAILPYAESFDQGEFTPPDLIRKIGQQGYLGALVAPAFAYSAFK